MEDDQSIWRKEQVTQKLHILFRGMCVLKILKSVLSSHKMNYKVFLCKILFLFERILVGQRQ